MKTIISAVKFTLASLLALTVIACGGSGGGDPAPNNGNTQTSPEPADRFVYSGNNDGTISILRVNKVTGYATPIAFHKLSSFTVQDIKYDQLNQRLIALTSRQVYTLSVDADTGLLTEDDSYDATTTVNYSHLVINDDASMVYAARGTSSGTQYVDTFSIGSDGSISSPTSTELTIDPDYVSLHPDGNKIYIVSHTDDHIHIYTLSASGALTGSPFPISTNQNPRSLTFNANGSVAYLGRAQNGNNENLEVFDVASNGNLTRKDFEDAGDSVTDLAISADGLRLYIIDNNNRRLGHYDIDQSTGDLNFVENHNLSFQPTDLALSYTGEELYISHDEGYGLISTTSINASDGTLDVKGWARVFANAESTIAVGNDDGAIQPTPTFLLAPDQSGLSAYSVANDGALTLESKENVSSTLIDGQIAFNANLELILGAGENSLGDNVITSHVLSRNNNNIDYIDDIDVVDITEPVSLTRLLLGKSGNYIYALDTKADASLATGDQGVIRVHSYDDNGNITATPVDTGTTNYEPRNMAMHPSGSHIYVANSTSDNLSNFSISSSDGSLGSPSNTSPGGFDRPTDILVHPNGRFAYASARNEFEIGRFDVQSNGTLDNIQRKDTGTINPGPMAIHPNGLFLYVGGIFGDNNISVFPIDSNYSLGTAVTTSLADDPDWIEVDPQGRFLYLRLRDGDVNVYSINSTTGALTSTGQTVNVGNAGGFLSTLTLVAPLQ